MTVEQLNLFSSDEAGQVKHNSAAEVGALTVRKVVDLYLHHASRWLERTTYEDRVRLLNKFCETHGDLPIGEAKPWHLSRWIESRTTYRSAATIRFNCARIRACFNWATKRKLIPVDPFQGLSYPDGEPRRAATDEEFRILLKTSGGRKGAGFRRVVAFLYYTGARPGEMSAIVPECVNLDTPGEEVVVLEKHKTRKRTHQARVIPLCSQAVKLVRWMLRHMELGQTYLFTNSRGGKWNRNSLSLRLRRLRREAKLPEDLVLYCMRHSFGTRAARRLNLKAVADCLGHSHVGTTQRYVHLNKRDLVKAVNQMHEVSVEKPASK